jgi:protein tyrosine phosphatase (PTP) superfamily phosphohydrolase (DUF442 family)
MGIEDSYNFRRVDDRVTTSGYVGEDALADLRAEGYDAVVNLLPDSQNELDEARIVQDQGLGYVYIPVDFERPARADFDAFVEAMDACDGQKVHVHCAANYRVTAFYSLYARRRGRCTDDEANALVQRVWDPAEVPAWAAFIADERQRTDT